MTNMAKHMIGDAVFHKYGVQTLIFFILFLIMTMADRGSDALKSSHC